MSLRTSDSTFIILSSCFCCVYYDRPTCPFLASNFEPKAMGLELMQDIVLIPLLVKNQ